MEVIFRKQGFGRLCLDPRRLQRRYGERRADLIIQRLAEMLAVETLADLRRLPGPRCHELVGSRRGQLSVDLDFPYRLLFEPAHNPIPRKPDGGLNWRKVTMVRILEISDTHG